MNARGEICTFPQFSCGKVLIIVEKSDNKEQDVNSFGAALGKTDTYKVMLTLQLKYEATISIHKTYDCII